MHRNLICGGFQSPYAHLSHWKKINASWLAIAKNMMCLEAEHARPISGEKIFCMLEGLASALSMFRLDLKPRSSFVTAPPTKLGRKSYLAGEAFTRWFAQYGLEASDVLQLEVGHSLSTTPSGTAAVKGKPGAPKPLKIYSTRRRPDFVAFAGSTAHLLESKGVAGRRIRDRDLERKLADALVQVSAIGNVNGLTPATRTGCSFGFDLKGARGTIWDPPEDVESYDVEVYLPDLIRRYYAAFPEDARLDEHENEFIGYEIIDGVRISVAKEVLERVRVLESNEMALAFFNLLQERRPRLITVDDRLDSHTGPDGIRLEVNWEMLGRYDRIVRANEFLR